MGKNSGLGLRRLFGRKSIYDGIEPYMVDMAGEGEAEVDLYGAVVPSHPVDFWTGEKVDGLFIALDDFLADLDRLKGMKSVRFNINSVGGEVNAGIAIFNKIRDLSESGVSVTTRVEGAADSAAALIAQAGDRREACIGSEVMVHCASCLLIDYYNSRDLDGVKAMLDAADARIAELLSDRSGRTAQEVKRLMQRTTWMNAEDAVREGFADCIVNQTVTVEAVNGQSNIVAFNGVPHRFGGIPLPPCCMDQGRTVRESPPPIIDKKTLEGGNKMTKEELEALYPEAVKEIRDEADAKARAVLDTAVETAVKAERERIRSIEGIEGTIPDKSLVQNAKYENPMSAGELALSALEAQSRMAVAWDAARAADVAESGTDRVTAEPVDGSEAENRRRDIMDGAALIAGIRKEAD